MVREQLGERAGFPDFVSMEVLHSDYIPQLRIMEEYTGEDAPPPFTEMLSAKVFSES